MKNKKIAVVMGGPTTEREVSLNTGKAILAALQAKGYNATAIDLNPALFIEQLKKEKIEMVFNAIHGKYGEDGLMQGVLEFLDIPYTGSGVFASAAAMDKKVSKNLFLAGGISTPPARLYAKSDFGDLAELSGGIARDLGLPVVIKPNAQGSSIGVNIVTEESQLESALAEVFKYSGEALAEKFIDGKELTVAILDTEIFPVIEIVPNSGKYDYHSKYTKGATTYLVPAPLAADVTAKVQKLALEAYRVLDCRGVARVDIMLAADDTPYVLEVNTVPGMTATSLVPKAAAAAGLDFPDLCERILFAAVR
ncbi:MAG: D-alanine--D-alanine ligase [Sporomusaceae bacterium]|jgi:D-alanine-D-alanine ligase|nr:D-alanine--D-alanine ligase [Sporomusaceae bacterium]